MGLLLEGCWLTHTVLLLLQLLLLQLLRLLRLLFLQLLRLLLLQSQQPQQQLLLPLLLRCNHSICCFIGLPQQ